MQPIIGIEGCIRRARETMYWPRMSTELKDYISKCDVCMAHRAMPSKEPLQHDFVLRPWSKVGADLCDFTLLVVCDYYGNFIEVENITKATTRGVSKALKAMFSRYTRACHRQWPSLLQQNLLPLSSPGVLCTLHHHHNQMAKR